MARIEREGDWELFAQSAKRLGVSPWKFNQIVASGVITTRRLPGLKPMALIADVQRVAENSIRPATAIAG
jgi:hypothetical protein